MLSPGHEMYVTESMKFCNFYKSNREQWFHCPSPLHPADLPTRGKYRDICNNLLWWEGPMFLNLVPRYWPRSPCDEQLTTPVALQENEIRAINHTRYVNFR